jgi:hypothetical protein
MACTYIRTHAKKNYLKFFEVWKYEFWGVVFRVPWNLGVNTYFRRYLWKETRASFLRKMALVRA